ncbi:MAG TPA: hypothetical protein VNG32_01145, partial [Candidatus Dormibacteraeota bacterium]|nr:hypothetical protein [Candidatus Dormibacteraeota bacterium]
ILSGPGQLVQLTELLQHNFSVSQSNSESRTNSLLRSYKAYKTGDYRYTRVGLIGQRSMAKIVGQFENAGVKFTGSDILGRPTAIEVDRSAVEKNFPETKGMSDAKFNDFLNGKFGVDSGLSFETAATGESYKLNIKGLKAQSISSFINKAGTRILGNSKAITAMKARGLKGFFGLDSLFHPFSRAIQNKIAAKAADIVKNNPKESEGAAEVEAASEVADSEYASSVSTVEEPGVQGFNDAKAADISFSQWVGSMLLPGLGALWAGGCTLNGLSGAIVSMNRSLIVLPAAVEATQLVSMGSQIKNGGNDLTVAQVGATVKGFTNSQGQNIWSGAALQAMEGSNKANALPRSSNGQIENDLPGEYKQAFGADSTSSTLKSVSGIMLSWFPLHYISGVIPGGQCGLVAGSAIIVTGVFAQVGLAIVNAPDGEAGDIALQGAVRAGEDVGSGYVQGKLLGPVINNLIDRIARATVAPKLTREAFSGALGGNLIAYGARAAANSSAILSGGLALGNNASTLIGSVGQQQQQQFRSENFFARTFNINDYRSLAGRLATNISPNIGTNLQLGINNILNIGGALMSIFGNLIPHVAADKNSDSWTGSYDWGFPQYGIPDNMLNDPALSDPPQNAEDVGKYLSSVCTDGKGNIGPNYGACDGSNGYTARIMKCFGDNLTYSEDSDIGGEVWDIAHAAKAASSDVNPVGDAYLGANCGDICPGTIADCGNSNKEQWEKIVMFVNDAFNIKALDCAGSNTSTSDQSCADVGFSNSGSSSSQPPTAGTVNGLVDPLSKISGLTAERVDQGVDYSGSGPILAIGSGTVMSTTNSGWPGGTFIVIKLDAFPGKYAYVAENCQSIKVQVAQHVNAGDELCTLQNASPNLEIGWADGNSIGNAMAHDVWSGNDSTSNYTAFGENFSQLLQKLGAPAGTIQPGATKLGSLPSGWPTW